MRKLTCSLLLSIALLTSGCWYTDSQEKLPPKKTWKEYTQKEFGKLPVKEQRRLWREYDRWLKDQEHKAGMVQ